MKSKPSPVETQNRIIRVFVSSTFRDMQVERDELIKFIFPQLRKLCEQRRVTWGEVDLRWGISDEQKAEGQVLPICLHEIQRCRPYFIGLLGERYGSLPDLISNDVIEQEPWLSDLQQRSVTELEILHGVLNNPEMAKHAFFYFRDPEFIKTLPADQQSVFHEEVTNDQIEKLGKQKAEEQAQLRYEKLVALKSRIRQSGFPVKEGFRNPQELGKWILQDLTKVINELYPEGSQLDVLDQEAVDHEAFAQIRARVYISRPAYFEKLDKQVSSQANPLVVLGESGSGKSALLANWALRYRRDHPDDLVLMHFIGATPDSTNWMMMLKRILGELKRKFNLPGEIPDQSAALRNTFGKWLNIASVKGKVILVIDALNQLDDLDSAPDLVWLPTSFNKNVRLLLSTLPSRPLDEIKKRGWSILTVESLLPDERKQLIRDYLLLFSRALDKIHIERIASARQCENPLFLRVLLDELRMFGLHERLGEQIELYLKAPTIPALYEVILRRCEHDYERERPGLVREALSLIWSARQGLSEAELMDLLGSHGKQMPRAYWSPLYLALEQSLLSRHGFISWSHDYMRQAVQNLYLREASMERQVHLHLADYFKTQPLSSYRRTEELPWQLARAEEWKRLNDLLSDLDFFENIWNLDPYHTKVYWAQLEANSSYQILEAYRKVLEHPDLYLDHAWLIANLLLETGHFNEASPIYDYLVKHFREVDNKAELGRSLINQGKYLFVNRNLDAAMAVFKEAESLAQKVGDKVGVETSLGEQAIVLRELGNLDGALALHKQEERICRELGDRSELARSLGNQGLLLNERGDFDGAMKLHKESERIYRELGDKDGMSTAFLNEASVLAAREDWDGAIALNKEAECTFREIGDRSGIGCALGNQAKIYFECGEIRTAVKFYKEAEAIFRELKDKAELAKTLGNLGNVLRSSDDLFESMSAYKEQEQICRELGDNSGLQFSLGGQANVLMSRKDYQGALHLYTERESICRQLGDNEGMAISLINHALALVSLNNKKEARRMLEESLKYSRKFGDDSLTDQIISKKAKWGL
jgi:tetratricopeptide (TPR) repeat protein